MEELTMEQQFALGESAAFKFFDDKTRMEVFKMTCDTWWRSRTLFHPLDFGCTKRLEENMRNLVGWYLSGTIFIDSTYTERIWVQVFDRSKENLVSLFYYDCFYGKFVAFEEAE